jgi:hypothetical protein
MPGPAGPLAKGSILASVILSLIFLLALEILNSSMTGRQHNDVGPKDDRESHRRHCPEGLFLQTGDARPGDESHVRLRADPILAKQIQSA